MPRGCEAVPVKSSPSGDCLLPSVSSAVNGSPTVIDCPSYISEPDGQPDSDTVIGCGPTPMTEPRYSFGGAAPNTSKSPASIVIGLVPDCWQPVVGSLPEATTV